MIVRRIKRFHLGVKQRGYNRMQGEGRQREYDNTRRESRMKRGFILVVLCLCAVLSLLPEEVSAADSASEREEKLYQLLL